MFYYQHIDRFMLMKHQGGRSGGFVSMLPLEKRFYLPFLLAEMPG